MKRLEQQALEADRQSVVKLLSSLPDNDVLGQASFRSRLSEIDRQLEAIGKPSLLAVMVLRPDLVWRIFV